MERLNLSAPAWWRDQMQEIANNQGTSISALVRFTCIQAWDLQPPEDRDQDQGGENCEDQ